MTGMGEVIKGGELTKVIGEGDRELLQKGVKEA
jgi:hypothetical protein